VPVLAKLRAAGLATGAFVLLLMAVYVVHARWLRVDVVLYSALLDGAIAAGGAALLLGTRAFPALNGFEKGQLVAIWLLAACVFAISVPTVIDRSLSFYLLEKLQQRGGGIREDRFADVFIKEYMKEDRLVEVRLTEQLASGTIVIEDGCVRLTPRGEALASFSRFFRRHLLPRQRLVMGSYSDVLTDPFRDSVESADYRCR
jgi:hypothetical protein